MRVINKEYTSGYLDRVYKGKDAPEVSPEINVTIRTVNDDDIEEEAIELFEMMKGSTIDIYIASLLELPTEVPVEEHTAEQQLRYVLTRVLTTAHEEECKAGHIVNISYGTIHDNIHKMVKVAVLGIAVPDVQPPVTLEYTITFTYDFQKYRKEAEELAAKEKAQAEEQLRQIQEEAEKASEEDIDAVIEEIGDDKADAQERINSIMEDIEEES